MELTTPTGTYHLEYPLKPTVTEMLRLTREMSETIGKPFTANDIEEAVERASAEVGLAKLEKRDPRLGEDAFLGMAVMLFCARNRAGERLTLEAAADLPIEDLDIVIDPGEIPIPEAAVPGPPKARKPRKRAASGPGARSGNPAKRAATRAGT